MTAISDPITTPRARYRKIEVRMWGDEKFRALSPMQPSGQALWVFLLTGPHTGPIPGVFRAGRAALAEELDWDLEAFDKAFQEVSEQGMVKADWKAKVVWIPNAIKCNRPESTNVVRSWVGEWALIPECDLKYEALESLRANVGAISEAFGKAFIEAFGKPFDKASGKACPNQEQEQEQEQEQQQDKSSNPNGLLVDSGAADLQLASSPEGRSVSRPDCPHQEIIALYHEILPMCQSIREWTSGRAQHLRSRWNEDAKRQNLDYWRLLFEYVGQSDFLTGRAHAGYGRSKPFLASLDWIVKPENFTKIREGRYHQQEAA